MGFAADEWRDEQGLQGYQEVCGYCFWGSGSLFLQWLYCLITSPTSYCSSINWLEITYIRMYQSAAYIWGTLAFTAVLCLAFAIVWLYPYPHTLGFQSLQLQRCNEQPRETKFSKILHVSVCPVSAFRGGSPWSRWLKAGMLWTSPAFWTLCVTSKPTAHQWWWEMFSTADSTCNCHIPEGEPHVTAT